MKFDKLTRRHFLEGAGGYALALPFLPSLLCNETAEAQVAVAPRIISIYVGHGAITEPYMYGDMQSRISWNQSQLLPSHIIRYGELPSGSMSPLFGEWFNPVKSKMTIVRGTDTPQYMAHNRSLGTGLNFIENPASHASLRVQPSIDQFLAYSNTFFSQQPTPHRSIIVSSRGSTSAALVRTGPGDRDYAYLSARSSAHELFDQVFGTTGGSGVSSASVDRVLPAYQSLRNNPRLSQTDKERLDSHLHGLQELQQRLALAVNCEDVPRPNASGEATEIEALQNVRNLNDVIVAALRCGQSRVVNMFLTENSAPAFSYNLHQTIHTYGNPPDHQTWFDQVRWQFQNVLADLVYKMDLVQEANGKTMLDNSLVILHWENFIPHDNFDNNIVLFGGLNGKFRMGRFYDYRNRGVPFHWGSNAGVPGYPGIPINTLLNSILQAAGVPASEYEQPRSGAYQYGGYSPFFSDNNWGGDDPFGVPRVGRQYLMDNYYIPSGVAALNSQLLPGGLYVPT
jgi:hypothetical protein